jgi:2-dehydropantoate 2-reductase
VTRNTDRGHTWFALGELHGRVTPRLEKLQEILGAAGCTTLTTNIWGAKWTKLTINGMFMAVCGILGIYDWEISQNPKLMKLCIRLGREALQVGAALGYRIEPIFGLQEEDLLGSSDEVLEKSLMTLLSHVGRGALNTIVQDHLKGRRTEVDLLNGLIARKGKEANVPTPLNEAINTITRQIEQETLKPDLSNLPLLEALVEKV